MQPPVEPTLLGFIVAESARLPEIGRSGAMKSAIRRFNWVRRSIASFSKTSWVYLVMYTVVFAFGFMLVQWPASQELKETADGLQYLEQQGNLVAEAIGSSLIAAGIAGWILFLWVVLSEERSSRLDLIFQLGLVGAFPERASMIKAEYDDRLVHASSSIDVLGFGLSHFREDYGSDFEKWSKNVSVRILLIDPSMPSVRSSYAKQRDEEEGNPAGTIAAEVAKFLETTESLWSDPQSGFKVRLYRAIPSVNICRIDDELFWGPFLVKKPSRMSPTLIVKRGGTLFDSMSSHFEDLWSDSDLSVEPPRSAA